MIKRGLPKGAELTVTGLPRQKKAKTQFSILPFSKLQPKEKDRKILECFVKKSVASLAINGNRTIQSCDVEKNLNEIPDTVRDTDNFDIDQVENFLNLTEKKQSSKWMCLSCKKALKDCESVACERCLMWCHLTCTSLKKLPKKANWFCGICKKKFMNM